ncbi:hypothetical protein ACET9Q_12990 [Aeromonas caviae]|jgi:hypothetical protein|uniref:Uncharacterized protein n=1 Tax=Aeromonas caviae TaxID=648 RepID=A0A6M4NQH4_AERCA|nr:MULTISPECIES: hypothetical protein [Aeromonas]MDH1221076.1 hypothetical protein [Aeromonas caviae]QJR99793.1 Hypothetical protein [Aeromonas caviae]QMV81576.1 Hypothetical protein [Aeromonas caviae]QQM77817.1 hypothetical protein JH254_20905 [Aeromonas caviae]QQV21630.1 hypothetical protein JJJ22_20965 [Aeromonas caviae]
MNNAGRTLDELLNSEEQEVELHQANASSEKLVSLNAQIPESIMRDLRLISAYTDTNIKDLIAKEIGRFTKRAKKKMIEQLNAG